MTKRNSQDGNQVHSSKEKINPVAEGSLRGKPPGAPGPSRQADDRQGGGFGGSEQGERGGPGSQQAGWSSRQQAERMRARAEEERLGAQQQSGYGGSEQNQRAGSQESARGPAGSEQSSPQSQPQHGGAAEQPVNAGKRHSKEGDDRG